ncbi:MAG: SMC-Scp complex subunit ScpB [Firmicutes bacterium]|nr:SMC-Scp complex subunit ScpB [Bacillota bacterium]
MDNRKALIEGLIFLSGEEGLVLGQIMDTLQISKEEAVEDLKALIQEYDDSSKGIQLVEYASRFKFVTKDFVYPYGQSLYEQTKPATLSPAAMETLAIIAYKQPITRVEIEEIRGVNCEMMLKKLQMRELIEPTGRLDVVGKPLLYSVTNQFLDAFQLETLKELPELPNKKEYDEELFVVEGES